MGMPAYDQCSDMIPITADDMRSYIRAHQTTGYTSSTVYVDTTVNDYEIKKMCRNDAHKHMQVMPKIVAHKCYKLSYQSVDDTGNTWRIQIGERTQTNIGILPGYNECKSPCESWETSQIYDITKINDAELCNLYNYIICMDKLSNVNMMALVDNMISASNNIISLLSTIGTSMLAHGSKIPYIGMVVMGAGGVITTISAIVSISNQITSLEAACISCAEIYHI